MNPTTERALTASGWKLGRQLDCEPYAEQALRRFGLEVPAAVIKFLRSFGGLTIQPHEGLSHETQGITTINPTKADQNIVFIERTLPQQGVFTEPDVVFQIATDRRVDLWYFMDRHGRVLADNGDEWFFIADNAERALDFMVGGAYPRRRL